jgi:ABC-type multidrug transport system ATPase subunit
MLIGIGIGIGIAGAALLRQGTAGWTGAHWLPAVVLALGVFVPLTPALMGPFTAGRQATLRMLVGLVAPSGGTATLGGRRYLDLPDPVRQVGAVLEASGYHPGRPWLRRWVRRLADEARTVLLSSHALSEVELTADHVLVLAHGRLIRSSSLAALRPEAGAGSCARTPDPEWLCDALDAANHTYRRTDEASRRNPNTLLETRGALAKLEPLEAIAEQSGACSHRSTPTFGG